MSFKSAFVTLTVFALGTVAGGYVIAYGTLRGLKDPERRKKILDAAERMPGRPLPSCHAPQAKPRDEEFWHWYTSVREATKNADYENISANFLRTSDSVSLA